MSEQPQNSLEVKTEKLREHRERFTETTGNYVNVFFFTIFVYYIYKSYNEKSYQNNYMQKIARMSMILFLYLYGHLIVYVILEQLYKLDKLLISKLVFLKQHDYLYHIPGKLSVQNDAS